MDRFSDEQSVSLLISGFAALRVIDRHADEIAYAADMLTACHPCRVRAAAWMRGTPADQLPKPCSPIGQARKDLELAYEVIEFWTGVKP